MSNECKACKFFVGRQVPDGADPNTAAGNCRRNPPVLLYMPIPYPVAKIMGGQQEVAANWSQQASNFPLVKPDWWCGEWQPALAIRQ